VEQAEARERKRVGNVTPGVQNEPSHETYPCQRMRKGEEEEGRTLAMRLYDALPKNSMLSISSKKKKESTCSG
jgi:hypothetical protein